MIKERPDTRYAVLATDVDYETAQRFKEIDEDDENYPNVQGVWLEDDYTRTYPYGSLASDVIGFTYSENAGAIGIESATMISLTALTEESTGTLTVILPWKER